MMYLGTLISTVHGTFPTFWLLTFKFSGKNLTLLLLCREIQH